MCLRILSFLLVVVEIQVSEVFSSSEKKVMLHDKKCMDFCRPVYLSFHCTPKLL
jgi:hypothetical protein